LQLRVHHSDACGGKACRGTGCGVHDRWPLGVPLRVFPVVQFRQVGGTLPPLVAYRLVAIAVIGAYWFVSGVPVTPALRGYFNRAIRSESAVPAFAGQIHPRFPKKVVMGGAARIQIGGHPPSATNGTSITSDHHLKRSCSRGSIVQQDA